MNTAAWSGGETEQIYIFPEDGNFESGDFGYRFSIASINDEKTEFTFMENIGRVFMAIDPFRLEIDGDGYAIARGETLNFKSQQKVTCEGKGKAFNVMIGDPSYRVSVQFLELQPGEFITEKIENHHFYYLYNGDCIVKEFSFREVMHQGDLLTVDSSTNQARLKIMSEKVIQLIRVDLLKSQIV